jgi:carbonic anhydrase
MSVVDEVTQANERYASGFAKGDLPTPPGKKFAVVTCMDARLDPARFLGLEEGDAHVIRNAGGIVNDETIRSLVISHQLLGTEEAIVVGHTGCGMLTFTNADVHEQLGPESESIDFQPFPDVAERVRESVEAIRNHPLLGDGFGATGFVYDVKSGRIEPV